MLLVWGMPKAHLSFSTAPKGPPPPLLMSMSSTVSTAQKKTKGISDDFPQAPVRKEKGKEHVGGSQPSSHKGQLPMAGKRKHPELSMSPTDGAYGTIPNEKPMAAAVKRKRPEDPAQSKRQTQPLTSPTTGATAAVATAAAAPPPAPFSMCTSVGQRTEHVLLVAGLPASADERSLRLHFAQCAPLQVQMLSDWANGRPRRAACVAVATPRAVDLALSPSMAAMDGERIRVCNTQTSHKSEGGFGGSASSAEMRGVLSSLEAKAAMAAGGDLSHSPRMGAVRHLLLSCDHGTAKAAVEDFCAVVRSGRPKDPPALLEQTLLRHRRL